MPKRDRKKGKGKPPRKPATGKPAPRNPFAGRPQAGAGFHSEAKYGKKERRSGKKEAEAEAENKEDTGKEP